MRFEWDEAKNQRNLLKHRVRFGTAALAFDDPCALTQLDDSTDERSAGSPSGRLVRLQCFLSFTHGESEMRSKSSALFRLAPRRRVKGKDMRKLTKEQKQDIAVIRGMRDEDIDLSDIPEVLDWSKAEIGKFYRPPKRSVTMRLDGDVIDWLKGYGKGYQTRVNLLLRHAMTSTTSETSRPRQSRPVGSRA